MKKSRFFLLWIWIGSIIFHSFLFAFPSPSKGAGIDYLIVYGSSVRSTQPIENFAAYKESLGYITSVVEATQAARESSGIDQAERLRNYFKKLYEDQGLKYVLIVGNPFVHGQRTRSHTGGSVPMRYCYPDPNELRSSNEITEDVHRIPTDLYYADMVGDWDSNGNGYFGEFGVDRANLVPNIYVGRIPFDDAGSIESILEQTIEFEQKSTDDKKKALFMASNYSTQENYHDHATLTEQMWTGLLRQKRFTRTTLYEQDGVRRSEYDSTFPLNNTHAVRQINTGNNSLTFILSNGGYMDRLMRYIWVRDKNFDDKPDPDECEWFPIIDTGDVRRFNTENPSIYFISGFMPMAPDWDQNSIGKELLLTQAVAVMGETRLSFLNPNWRNQRDGGMRSIVYHFTQNLLDGKSLGESLFHSFAYSTLNDYYNAYSFGVLYGDPSLGLEKKQRAEARPPSAPGNLRASLRNNNVVLNWSPSSTGTYTIDGYSIFRGTSPDVIAYVANVSASTLTWEDRNIRDDTTYYYYVSAFDIRRNFSDPSNTVSISRPSAPRDTTPPVITIFEPSDQFQTAMEKITVAGQVTDDDAGVDWVSVNNRRTSLDRDGNFSEEVSLTMGSNTIIVQAQDKAGNQAEVSINVNRVEKPPEDNMPPNIRIFYPRDGDFFTEKEVEINGRIWDEDSGIDRAKLNDNPIPLARDGTFEISFMLEPGINRLLFEAWDIAGNYASEELSLILESETVIRLTIGRNVAYINDQPFQLDTPPTIMNGRTMVPIRFISEAFGAEVEWDGETRTVRIYLEATLTRITLQIDNTIARINERVVNLDTPPTILNGRTMVPIRFISEAFGAEVEWDGATQTVTITLKN